MADLDHLWNLASGLLDSAVAVLTDPPARQFVHLGKPIWDCELVAVHMSKLEHDGIGSGRRATWAPREEFHLTVLRCWPTRDPEGPEGTPPSAAQLNDASRVGLRDMDATRTGLANRLGQGTLFGSTGCLGTPRLGPLSVLRKAGYAGFALPVTIRAT